MKARLAKYRDGTTETQFAVLDPRCTIGRDPGSAVQLPDPGISKQHAVIERTGEGWTIKDTGSTNGIFVNDSRVEYAALQHGDKVALGPLDFVFETSVDGKEWTPTYFIDMSSESEERTMVDLRPPGPDAS